MVFERSCGYARSGTEGMGDVGVPGNEGHQSFARETADMAPDVTLVIDLDAAGVAAADTERCAPQREPLLLAVVTGEGHNSVFALAPAPVGGGRDGYVERS